MAWKTKRKDLGTAKLVPHTHSNPVVIGRAPGIGAINFSPLALFGAAARCSHLHLVNPAIVTPESLMIAALVEQHVDDVKNDFAIEASAGSLKDYVKSYFAGTVAAGLSYLKMIHDGYVWLDHFENLGGSFGGTRKTPDFVFAGSGTGVALVESKGARGRTPSAFDARVRDGYTDQVEPHLGHAVGGVTATHGYCIGAYLQSTSKADLRIHHTAVPVSGNASGGADPQSISVIQQGSYARAFAMAHSDTMGRAILDGDGPERVPFVRFGWRGLNWLSSYLVGPFGIGPGWFRDHFPEFERRRPWWWIGDRQGPTFGFAIEETIGLAALARFLPADFSKVETEYSLDIPMLPMDSAVDSREQSDGVFFPDGLAVVTPEAMHDKLQPAIWERKTGRLS